MFINVSNNLPKTSYMKMMDVWLLFNLLYPFIVVLLHTYMDTLRNDEEGEINHHGKTITINDETDERISDNKIEVLIVHRWILTVFFSQVKPTNLVSVNEKVELEAQKEFYRKIELEMGKKKSKQLEQLRRVNLIYLPLMAICFVVIFWFVGLKNAELI